MVVHRGTECPSPQVGAERYSGDSPNNLMQREEVIREKNIQNKFVNCNLQRLHYADR